MKPYNKASFDGAIIYPIINAVIELPIFKYIHPNAVTLVNYGITFVLLTALFKQQWAYIVPLAGLRAVLDCVDGAIARKYNKETVVGDYLDGYGDEFLLVGTIIILFLTHHRLRYIMIALYAIIAFISNGDCLAFTLGHIMLPLSTRGQTDAPSPLWIFVHDNTVLLMVIWYSLIVFFGISR
jgi:phosphatidylglycerophosphate synthase